MKASVRSQLLSDLTIFAPRRRIADSAVTPDWYLLNLVLQQQRG
jgi:hypothetical protein